MWIEDRETLPDVTDKYLGSIKEQIENYFRPSKPEYLQTTALNQISKLTKDFTIGFDIDNRRKIINAVDTLRHKATFYAKDLDSPARKIYVMDAFYTLQITVNSITAARSNLHLIL